MSMRKFISPLLSLFTIVGGHLLNRRLDFTLLFFILLVLAAVLPMTLIPMVMFSASGTDTSSLTSMSLYISYTLSAGLLSVVVASVIVSYIKASSAESQPRLSISGKIAGSLSTLLSVAIIAWAATTTYTLISPQNNFSSHSSADNGSNESLPIFSTRGRFNESVRYSSGWDNESGLEQLPEGNESLTGKISYQGMPAKGVTLYVVINSRFKSLPVTTGDNGYFHLSVPGGGWTINRITLTDWQDQPDAGNFTVTAGLDPALEEEMYRDGPDFNSTGLHVISTQERSPQPGLSLSIYANPKIITPSRKKQSADPEVDHISWLPVASAQRYQLQLHKTKHDGTTTSYYPTTWLNTENTTVPLSQFSSVEDNEAVSNEYSVKVYAFDEAGRLISSNGFIGDNTLILNGRSLVSMRDIDLIGDVTSMSSEELTQRFETSRRDRQRIEAATTLIKDEMIDAARVLLERVETPSLAKEKQAAVGMALAAEGRCEKATNLFDELSLQHGNNCKPEFVRQLCPE